jgi:capsid protein
MRSFMRWAAACLLAISSLSMPVQAADMQAGAYVYDPGVCGDQRLLGTITHRFRHQVRNVPNLPQVDILEFREIHEVRYLPAMEDRPIGRRYCAGRTVLSSGDTRSIWYMVEEGQGFASIGDNVEFCVAGFDRWHVYNGHCRVLR